MPFAPRVLLLGASVRAAAYSAIRAGWSVWGADLFADTDLADRQSFHRVTNYPDGLVEIARQGEPGPWLYTGALENRPDLVERISKQRLLWGNPGDVLTQVRSPRVFTALAQTGIPCPAVCFDSDARPDKRWLLKPRAGAGGRGIQHWTGKHSQQLALVESSRGLAPGYRQEFVEGEACAAIYIAGHQQATLLGVTRQLVGQAWLHASAFQYCGSIGPLHLQEEQRLRFERLGHALLTHCALKGLFGVDCILRNGTPFPLEINPRYTASVEVLEHAQCICALDLHRQAFESLECGGSTPLWIKSCNQSGVEPPFSKAVIGKAILFAPTAISFPQEGPWITERGDPKRPWNMPVFADIPAPGERIGPGRPVITFFARAETIDECEQQLRRIARHLDRQLFAL